MKKLSLVSLSKVELVLESPPVYRSEAWKEWKGRAQKGGGWTTKGRVKKLTKGKKSEKAVLGLF